MFSKGQPVEMSLLEYLHAGEPSGIVNVTTFNECPVFRKGDREPFLEPTS